MNDQRGRAMEHYERWGTMPETTLRPGFFLTGRAWLDSDGRHAWFAHDCTTERVTTMLPWPTWHSTGLRVEPSLVCDACGFHEIVALDAPDQAYRCMATFEHDGRWCELAKEHGGLHRNGSTCWGEYDRG